MWPLGFVLLSLTLSMALMVSSTSKYVTLGLMGADAGRRSTAVTWARLILLAVYCGWPYTPAK